MRTALGWLRSLVAAALVAACLTAPAWADRTWTLKASALVNANGNSTNQDVTGARTMWVDVDVTAGAATVNPFKVLIQGSNDGGTTWGDVLCAVVAKDAGGTVTATTNTSLIVNEVAAVTSATAYTAQCDIGPPLVRAQWYISGGGSETFSVTINVK